MPWPVVLLSDVCALKYGKALPASSRVSGDVLVFGSNGEVGTHDTPFTSGPTIVIGRKGSVGEVHLSAEGCWPIDTTYFVDKTTTSADVRWLAYRLRGLGLTGMNRAAAVPGLNRDDAYRLKLLLPPIEEQQRIADILDRADALRAKRREALALLDDLTQSIFLDMFGDPNNPTVAVGRLGEAAEVQIGPFGSLLHVSDYIEGGVPLINPVHIVAGKITPDSAYSAAEEKAQTLELYRLQKGDVIMGRRGEMGRCAIVEAEHVGLLCGTGCLVLRPRRNTLTPTYLTRLLSSSQMKSRLEGLSLGATLPNLNRSIVADLRVPLPAVESQHKFRHRIDRAEQAKREGQQHLGLLDELFTSLQQRAFGGLL